VLSGGRGNELEAGLALGYTFIKPNPEERRDASGHRIARPGPDQRWLVALSTELIHERAWGNDWGGAQPTLHSDPPSTRTESPEITRSGVAPTR